MVTESQIEELRRAATDSYARLVKLRGGKIPVDRASCLYHYTSAQGLQGILKDSALRASDTAFLNDSKEIAFAAEPLAERMIKTVEIRMAPYFKDGVAKLYGSSDPDDICTIDPATVEAQRTLVLAVAKEFIDSFACKRREEIAEMNDIFVSGSMFVACLSEKHDQLGQWRAYGQGGYAIGFRRDKLADVALLGPVSYGIEAVTALCDEVIEHFDHFDTHELAGVQERSEVAQRLGYVEAVSYCLPKIALVKHESFAEEHEWRLVKPRYDLEFEGISVRFAGNRAIPYVMCPFEKSAVAEIVIGPGGDLHSERAVRALLAENDYDHAKITISHSTAPFRG